MKTHQTKATEMILSFGNYMWPYWHEICKDTFSLIVKSVSIFADQLNATLFIEVYIILV